MAPAWIVLHPNEKAHTVGSVEGERRTIPHPTIDELVQLVDEVRDAATR